MPLRDPAGHTCGISPTADAPGEIEHFFAVYKDLEDHATETDGFRDRGARERAAAQA